MRSHRYLYFGLAGFLACVLFAQAATVWAGSDAASLQARSNVLPAMGQAPLLKFKILNQSAQVTTYAVIFGVGDEILGGLTQFAEDHHISAARITGIGAIQRGTLAWFNPQRKTYRHIVIDRQAEVLSLLGDIAIYRGKPVVHAHMVVGFPDGTAHGGHLLQAYVRPTLEVIVTAYPRPLYRKFDPERGLAVIDPSMRK
jgi:predicted DNA-binding protein with PD1-like motif